MVGEYWGKYLKKRRGNPTEKVKARVLNGTRSMSQYLFLRSCLQTPRGLSRLLHPA